MSKPKPMSEKEIRAAMDRASGLIYGCDEFVIDAARYALAAIGADNLRLRAEVDRLTRELRDARSRILSNEERTKLTGDALHAEAEADRLRAMVKSLGGDA